MTVRGAWPALTLALLSAGASAQQIVVSARPDDVALTVYRDPYGSDDFQLGWLRGFALVTETRRVSLPAGDVDLRFEGVTEGIVPQSAIVTGLGDNVRERNRDAQLLSPGTLLDASLGQRVHLRRTSRATGAVAEQDAIVRATRNGVVIETAAGIEALRCTGLAETLRPEQVPAHLSAKPTLSVGMTLDRPVDATVTLSYLTSNFDWRAHYVAALSPDETSLSLFAWLTLANGDSTTLSNAETMAVAGKLNRESVNIIRPEARSINLSCWPSDTTSDVEEYGDDFAGGPPPPPPPAPPPPPVAARAEIVVTGSKLMAQREALGDLKLYRIPAPVTVAARSQKQVALLEQPTVKAVTLYRWRAWRGETSGPVPAQRLLVMQNRTAAGLGLPLPAGKLSLFAVHNGAPFLIGEGAMTDRAEGEKVEVAIDRAPGVLVQHRQVAAKGKAHTAEIVVSNDLAHAIQFEAIMPDAKGLSADAKLIRRDGERIWQPSVPANSSRTLRYRYRD